MDRRESPRVRVTIAARMDFIELLREIKQPIKEKMKTNFDIFRLPISMINDRDKEKKNQQQITFVKHYAILCHDNHRRRMVLIPSLVQGP